MEYDRAQECILRIARAGSDLFALSEYTRLGLDKVRDDEDIMALHGRLYKDLSLSQSGKEAIETARLSAQKYEEAFKVTQGFYSGINASTMSLLAGFPEEMVQMRAQRILDILPATEKLDSEIKYFIEATRAEAYLLLGDSASAQKSMQTALDHDPLNYTAHASTLKQFRMIANHRNETYDWLADFQPPIAIHFAGHMFGVKEEMEVSRPSLTKAQINTLKVEISELLQAQDIGFGYGALAAGSDIMIAEAILEEGGELHITLPVGPSLFIDTSVKPYGVSWIERFEACLSRASSVHIISSTSSVPVASLEKQASLSSMGAAIRHAASLSVASVQLLIWDEKTGSFGTAADANLWDVTKRPRYNIQYTWSREKAVPSSSSPLTDPVFTLETTGSDEMQSFDDLASAISKALALRKNHNPKIKQVLDIQGAEMAESNSQLFDHAPSGSIVLSERAANHITVYHFEDFSADFIRTLKSGSNIYALRKKGGSTI